MTDESKTDKSISPFWKLFIAQARCSESFCKMVSRYGTTDKPTGKHYTLSRSENVMRLRKKK